MALDVRTWFAVDGCRRRVRTGMAPEEAAMRLSRMLDVDFQVVLRLSVTAEQGRAEARAGFKRVSHTTPAKEPPDAP